MDDAPNTKRPRHDVISSIQNPNSLPSSTQSHFDLIISSLLSLSVSAPSLLSSPPSIGRSFDRALEKSLASASGDVSVQDRLVDRSVELASLLLESTKRCFRKRASVHNSNSWPFPQELTIKMFSMLDKKSLMRAMACCTMFHKCAMDPLCYSHIELKDENVDDGVVHTMIHRAGKELRSLELGHAASPLSFATKSLLTGSCLSPLSYNHCFIGNRLRSLHLYDLICIYENSCIVALSACPNITDLKIVGMSCGHIFESLTRKSCRMIEHLFLEAYGFPHTSVRDSGLVEFVTNIPNLTSLTLIGFGIDDAIAQILIEGSRKLNCINLSRTLIKGRFLRDLVHSFKDSPLETLILRDCNSLEEKEVSQFLNSLFTGNLSLIRHIDVSNIRGLVCDGGKRSKKPNLPLEKLKEERSNVKFVADFTSSLSRAEMLLRGISYGSDEDGGWAMSPGFDSDEDINMANFEVNHDMADFEVNHDMADFEVNQDMGYFIVGQDVL